MIDLIPQRLLGVLMLAALAACSGKKDVPPPVAAVQPPAQAAPAVTPPPPAQTASASASAPAQTAADNAASNPAILKKASLDCEDRTIVLEATCSDVYGPRLLACSKQTLTVMDRASHAVQTAREFKPVPGTDDDPPMIDEKIGTLSCTRSQAGERYIVAAMFNGGNCEECEWHELYDWDGKLIGSDRDRKKPNALLNKLADDLYERPDGAIARNELKGFYSENPQ
jgi:hypothetical protein